MEMEQGIDPEDTALTQSKKAAEWLAAAKNKNIAADFWISRGREPVPRCVPAIAAVQPTRFSLPRRGG